MDKFRWLEVVFLVLAWAAAILMAQSLPFGPVFMDAINPLKWEVRYVVRY